MKKLVKQQGKVEKSHGLDSPSNTASKTPRAARLQLSRPWLMAWRCRAVPSLQPWAKNPEPQRWRRGGGCEYGGGGLFAFAVGSTSPPLRLPQERLIMQYGYMPCAF